MTKSREPFFNFSEPLPVYWAGVLVGIQILTIFAYKLIAPLVGSFAILVPFGAMPIGNQIVSLLGHGFVHSGWSHLLLNSLMGIVFGIVTIRGAKVLATSKGKSVSGNGAFLIILLAGIILGGLFQWGVWGVTNTTQASMIGASGGVSALFAVAGWAMGGKGKMLQFGFGWVVINCVLVLAEPFFGVRISWAGHLGGYLAGMLLAPFLVRANSTGFTVLR